MRLYLLGLTVLLFVSPALAATLTITPDKATYQVGEQIVLNVHGDAEWGQAAGILGRLLFDPALASHVSSQQELLTSFGVLEWIAQPLNAGPGFAEAFDQFVSNDPYPVDGPLTASVTLLATAPGSLSYSWDTTSLSFKLRFFGVVNAPGGSVTIVPEPGSGLLLLLGLLGVSGHRRAPERKGRHTD